VVEPKHAPYWRERRERNRAVISRASRLIHAALDEAIAQCDRVLSRMEGNHAETTAEGRRNRTARAYLAALDRLIAGKATHPDYAGRPVRITPAAVAKEARRSCNPLYTTHRALLAEIEAAVSGSMPAGRSCRDRLETRTE
jgi:hypothetical protein